MWYVKLNSEKDIADSGYDDTTPDDPRELCTMVSKRKPYLSH